MVGQNADPNWQFDAKPARPPKNAFCRPVSATLDDAPAANAYPNNDCQAGFPGLARTATFAPKNAAWSGVTWMVPPANPGKRPGIGAIAGIVNGTSPKLLAPILEKP